MTFAARLFPPPAVDDGSDGDRADGGGGEPKTYLVSTETEFQKAEREHRETERQRRTPFGKLFPNAVNGGAE